MISFHFRNLVDSTINIVYLAFMNIVRAVILFKGADRVSFFRYIIYLEVPNIGKNWIIDVFYISQVSQIIVPSRHTTIKSTLNRH